ncbi:hypothetical protein ID866_12044 [Astraeus odoratus]|nr:hypothetical protein ID866_12044 [Astraeus odoratus]
MSTCKSSTTMGALAVKTVNWTKVLDEELVTDIDDTDLVEEVEQCQKDKEVRHQREAEEQKWEAEKVKQATAAEARKQQQADSEVQVHKTMAELHHTSGHQEKVGMWIMCEDQGEGRERKKRMKKADGDDDDEVVILSGQKTKQQGGGKSLKEISDQQWGELIQAVSSRMDIANSHLEKIVSVAQSNGWKMQWHFLLMEGLVSQQQMLVSKLVKIAGAAGSGGV